MHKSNVQNKWKQVQDTQTKRNTCMLLLVHQINHYELWKKITKYKSEIKCKVIIEQIIVFLWGRELGKSGCRNVLVLFYKQGSV